MRSAPAVGASRVASAPIRREAGSMFYPRPDLRLAKNQEASFHPQRVGAGRADRARIGAAVVGIIEMSDILGRILGGGTEVERNLDSQERSRTLASVVIVLVGRRLPGSRIFRLLEPDDGTAHVGAAFRQPDMGVRRIREPHAGNVGGMRGTRDREAEESESDCNQPRHRAVLCLRSMLRNLTRNKPRLP